MRFRGRSALVAVVVAPTVVALGVVRPSQATQVEPFGTFGITATAGGVRTAGDLGVSGGLVTVDSGSAFINARLDSAPSSFVLADPVEPGTLVRTVIGQVNTNAMQQVLSVPDAEAAYPGKGKASTSVVGPQTAGPLVVTGGAATAEAKPTSATGTSTGADLVVADVVQTSGSLSAVSMTGSSASGRLTAIGRTDISTVRVAGVIELHGVSARTKVTAVGAAMTSAASLTIGKATVAGQEVTIDADGAHAAGQNIDAATLRTIQDNINAVLSAAGIQVHAFAVVHSVSGRSALADSGGVIIDIATPDLPGGVSGNHLSVAIGKVTLTGATKPPLTTPIAPEFPALPPVVGSAHDGGITVGPPAGAPAPPTAVRSDVPTFAGPRLVRVAGRQMSLATALGAFGCWQLLSLSGATLYAFVERRRRMLGVDAP